LCDKRRRYNPGARSSIHGEEQVEIEPDGLFHETQVLGLYVGNESFENGDGVVDVMGGHD
jgi:hypothetical protein